MENFKFKKKFGQNFLIDKNVVNKIVSDIEVKPNSLVIEIGCGSGNLTKVLCEKFDKVLGYEIDLEVKEHLYDNLKDYSNYEIIFGDFLDRDVASDIKFDYDNLYVVANLPYYITTPIIEKITLSSLDPELIRVMVQKEVGDRFTAKVGTREYSSLSVFLDYHYVVKKNFVVNRNSFYPRPNVDSLIVSFYKKDSKVYVKDIDLFYGLVRDSFKFKRKNLRNNLKGYDLDVISNVLSKYNFDLSVRAEQLSLDIFCEISNELSI